jgi:hypothetical protein
MVQISRPSASEQVESILQDPDAFFAGATARAWPVAVAEVAADLSQRARRRARADGRFRARRPAWLPASIAWSLDGSPPGRQGGGGPGR